MASPADRPVTEAMSHPVISVSIAATLTRALRMLAAGQVRHLVVMGADSRCPGILADRTLAAEWARDPIGFGRRRVRDVLDPTTPTVSVSSTVAAAARAMQRYQTDAVAVLDSAGRVLGILTATDLVRVLAGDPTAAPEVPQ
jgi:CBS domain-containing protein